MKEAKPAGSRGWLDVLERVGNKLPEPATLFLLGTVLIFVLSYVAASAGWLVQPLRPVAGPLGELQLVPHGEPLAARNLLSSDGIYWLLKNLVQNFITFPPLGIVLVGMLGIGVAERTGLMAASLKAFAAVVPAALLTPAMVFLGIMSSLGIDAGYIVLPPLAMALYRSVGRSPIVGLAAVFAGVSAGFNANLVVTGLDPMLAAFSQEGARIIDPDYLVNPACNWWFMIASTFFMTLVGWFVTARLVEPRFARKTPEQGGPAPADDSEVEAQKLTADERRGLAAAGIAFAGLLALFVALANVPGWPLQGSGTDLATGEPEGFARWVQVMVPLIMLGFLIPALVYGKVVGAIKGERDAVKLMIGALANMAPIIVLAFFAAQFIRSFDYSNLGGMLAMSGGQALASAALPPIALMVVFVGVTAVFNLFVGSMSAKYAMFAPIFVPMFMMVGISPELTQAAYRIGDSITNIITPLNAYLVIILVAMRKYVPEAGIGTLVSTMLPYTIVFGIAWTILLAVWMQLGLPLGIDGGLQYLPPAAH